MYSMVLVMALGGGADVPAWHGCRGGNGCYGGYASCYGGHGCYGGGGHGCWGSGHGCRGGHFLGGHGCNGGGRFLGGHGCRGNGHGCYGGYGHGCYGGGHGHGCYGGGYGHGCYGGGHGHGCHGGHIHYQGGQPMPAGQSDPAKEAAPAPKKTSLNAPATIVVSLPAEAKLTIDDVATKSTSTTRVFASPVLENGKDYVYTLKAEMDKDGKTVSTAKQVTVRAGQETRVTLEFSESVASR